MYASSRPFVDEPHYPPPPLMRPFTIDDLSMHQRSFEEMGFSRRQSGFSFLVRPPNVETDVHAEGAVDANG